MKTVGVMTLGCKVNMYESEFVINELAKAGYIIKNFTDICDVYIINTCTVTNNSDSKSKKMIRQAIKRNPNACVVAMGCFIAANPDIEIDGLDIIAMSLGNVIYDIKEKEYYTPNTDSSKKLGEGGENNE